MLGGFMGAAITVVEATFNLVNGNRTRQPPYPRVTSTGAAELIAGPKRESFLVNHPGGWRSFREAEECSEH